MKLLDGKKTAGEIQAEILTEVLNMTKAGERAPHLAAILVGNNAASETYINSKVKTCESTGFISSLLRLPETATEKDILNKVNELNMNKSIDGFIVQLPLPAHINEQKIVESIYPQKDVDGFHPLNFGRMALGFPAFMPATPKGILELIKRYKIETEGKHCVILGRSNIVGSPLSILMYKKAYPGNCTVTVCHSNTHFLKSHTQKADILIVAVGKPGFVSADMVKEGAVVIDVGIHRIHCSTNKSGYKLAGDVKFDEVAPKCSYITPVPGGVGPMTITGLLQNTLLAAKNR